jgi:hypothetical protein
MNVGKASKRPKLALLSQSGSALEAVGSDKCNINVMTTGLIWTAITDKGLY